MAGQVDTEAPRTDSGMLLLHTVPLPTSPAGDRQEGTAEAAVRPRLGRRSKQRCQFR